jgi:hypothetical protein
VLVHSHGTIRRILVRLTAAIAAEIQPPETHQPDRTPPIGPGASDTGQPHWLSTAVLRHIPTVQQGYDRWREIWQAFSDDNDAANESIAARFTVSTRTVQHIRRPRRAARFPRDPGRPPRRVRNQRRPQAAAPAIS